MVIAAALAAVAVAGAGVGVAEVVGASDEPVALEVPTIASAADAGDGAVVTRQSVGPVAAGSTGDLGEAAVPDIQTGTWSDPAPVHDHLVLVGDSLAQETSGLIAFLSPGVSVAPKFWGGTAPCDWRDVDLEASPTSVVVITFTGNSLTDCMSDGVGGHLIDQPLVDAYRHDVGVLVDHARQAGARVLLIGQPYRASSFDADLEVDGINAIYREYASAFPFVSFIDAGAAVETSDGRYTDRLPCTPYDSDCAANGTTVVRGDGVHFCPIVGQNPCSIWSSGAFRFASEIARAANDPATYD